MRHTASSSAKGGASSPYVQGLAPSSQSIQQLMDDQEAAYIRVTTPEPETRGVAPLRHRSHIVRDRYFAAAAAVSTSPKGYPPKNNYTKQTRPGKGAATRSDAPLESPCRTPPRPTSAVTNASTHAALAKKRITSFEHRRLYHFYNRQVFSLGGNNMPSDQRLEMAPSLPSASVPYHVRDNDRGSGSEDEVDEDNFDTAEDEDGFDERILDAHPQTDDLYDQCFEADWTASQIEKVVKDGVECRRIYAAIKPHYRVLVCLFRLHATVAPTPTMDAKFDDVKATHVFVSCLPVWPDDLAVVAQELTLSTFQEALTKAAYFKCALALCNGDDDVCPGRANSERCKCHPNVVADEERYSLHVLVYTLQVMLTKCGAPAGRRSRRQSIKHDSLVKV
ncbi:hypothetical protein AaE_012433 [Aphanomyces astaci]|uniref:Uncharacterized protein n=1 Tax=Aphanomyces astaci TaxID=112090 RepID=A0A6A4ZG56_APHAT|nr:hypothetical protein AaE_012433 [Aphanomyces astaci]